MIFNFDMHHVGQTIARLRRERNMTQMQLADEVGVSFQAVSNWERAQSMPDISKLPELAALFDTTIDELLGRHSPLIEKAAADKLDELPTPTVEEVAEAAPLLPPKQMGDLADKLMATENLPDMMELLPFLPTAKVDELLRQRVQRGGSIANYAAFASTAVVDEIVLMLEAEGKSMVMLAPFASQHTLDEIAQARIAAGQSITELLPFISSGNLISLARGTEAQGQSCVAFAPFLPSEVLNDIALTRLQKKRSIHDLLPFVGEALIVRLAESASTNN